MSQSEDEARDPVPPPEHAPDERHGAIPRNRPAERQPDEEDFRIRPACECQRCEHWSRDADWCPEHPEFKVPDLEPRGQFGHPPLVKPQRSEPYEPIHKYKEPENCGMVKKLMAPKVLVHGPNIPEPLRLVAEAEFDKGVLEAMQKFGYVHTTDMQAFAWPGFSRKLNMMLIGSQGCGKSMSYLPGLISVTLNAEPEPDKYKGPLSLILCPDSASCEEVYARVVTIFPEASARLKISLMSAPINNVPSCNILITRATVLVEALKMRMFNLKRLCHLIIEEGYQVFSKEKPQAFAILKHCNDVLAERVSKKRIQFIVASTRWNDALNTILHIMFTSPLVIFDNFIEAAIYGGVQIDVKFILSKAKFDFIYFLINSNYRYHRTVIFCTLQEIPLLTMILRNRTIDILTIDEDLPNDLMMFKQNIWAKAQYGHYRVLLCTDQAFDSFLQITNADWVMHYSLSATWTRFIKRFQAFRHNLSSPLDPPALHRSICLSSVLIDQSCTTELPRILDVMEHAGMRFSESLAGFVAEFRAHREEEKIQAAVPLCQDVKMFGRCDVDLCPRRHCLTHRLDQFCKFTNATAVRFQIIDVFDVTRYLVQVTHEWNQAGKLTLLNGSKGEITYPNQKTIRHVLLPKLGAYYCLLEGPNTRAGVFYLCKLEKLIEANERALIRMTMTGEERTVEVSKLYIKPENFFLCEVIMASLVPPYNDRMYSEKARHQTRLELNRLRQKFTAFKGEVALKLSRTMWLSNVVQIIPVSDRDVIPFNLSERMLELKLAEYSEAQLERLYKLCNKGNLIVDRSTLPKLPPHLMTLHKVHEAFLGDQVEEVLLSSAVDPHELYLRLPKFDSLLRQLEEDVTEYVRDNNPEVTEPTVGTVYLALDPRGVTFSRAKLLRVHDKDALVFYVDHGDEAVISLTNLRPIPTRFKTRLPFQAIQCKLFGIAPCTQQWEVEAVDVLYNRMFLPNSDYFRPLYAKSLGIDSGIGHTSHRYSIVLKDGEGAQRLINRVLVDCGLAISYDLVPDFAIPTPAQDDDDPDDSDHAGPLPVSQLGGCLQVANALQVREAESVDDEGFFFDVPSAADFLSTYSAPVRTVMLCTEDGAGDADSPRAPAADPEPGADSSGSTASGDEAAAASGDRATSPPEGVRRLLTPQIYWAQFRSKVRLRLMIHDVANYNVRVEDDLFSFRATCVDGREYSVRFELFRNAILGRHAVQGDHVTVYVHKLEDVEWDQLYRRTRARLRNVLYEFANCSISEKKRKFLELGVPDFDEVDETDDLVYFIESDNPSDFDDDFDDEYSS